jgi:hypothetical protein
VRIWWIVAAICIVFPAQVTDAQRAADEAAPKINQEVISKLSSLYGYMPEIIKYIDLTKVFDTKSRWSLVVGKEPDKSSPTTDAFGDPIGALLVCFVKNDAPECSEKAILAKYQEQNISFAPGERPFYELLASEIVYSGAKKAQPLLMLKTCTMHGANGTCGLSTFLFDYDRQADHFRLVFFNVTGRNNNQEARFVESGPLRGAVIVVYPTSNAPFTYFVEAYKRNTTGIYAQALRYRGRTGYGDGNRLSVIDSEMPEILRRLNLWKLGDPLPVPPKMPVGCARLTIRKGILWCE